MTSHILNRILLLFSPVPTPVVAEEKFQLVKERSELWKEGRSQAWTAWVKNQESYNSEAIYLSERGKFLKHLALVGKDLYYPQGTWKSFTLLIRMLLRLRCAKG